MMPGSAANAAGKGGSHEAKSQIAKSEHAEGKAAIRAMRHCALALRTPFMVCRQ